MYAVIETGGKQYRVTEGDRLKVERLPVEAGDTVDVDRVLLVASEAGVAVGNPTVSGASVKAEVLSHGKRKKIRVFKMKRRKNYRRTQGHRQAYTELRIAEIKSA